MRPTLSTGAGGKGKRHRLGCLPRLMIERTGLCQAQMYGDLPSPLPHLGVWGTIMSMQIDVSCGKAKVSAKVAIPKKHSPDSVADSEERIEVLFVAFILAALAGWVNVLTPAGKAYHDK